MKSTIAKMKQPLGWSKSEFKLQNKELTDLKVDLEYRLYIRHQRPNA